jgi:transposase
VAGGPARDAVAQMDLAAFYGAYRADGHGRAAFDPGMVVALLLYAYARGTRSSRAIERACEEDVAFRVIAANQVPDHTTLARFASATRRRSRACSVTCWRCARRRGWCRSA